MSDVWTRRLAAAAVLLVAGIAAVISYMHIYALARGHGQSAAAAALMPLSVDGTVAAASLQMLRAARAGRPVDWLQRAMLALGVAATLTANVLDGWPHGAAAAVISGWPAVAFIGSAEMAIRAVQQHRPAAPAAVPAAGRVRGLAGAADRPGGRNGGVAPRASRGQDTGAVVAALVAARPDITSGELAVQLGRSERTARRHLDRVRASRDRQPAPA